MNPARGRESAVVRRGARGLRENSRSAHCEGRTNREVSRVREPSGCVEVAVARQTEAAGCGVRRKLRERIESATVHNARRRSIEDERRGVVTISPPVLPS